MMKKRCFGDPPPGLDTSSLSGMLLVIEGPDSSGRSTHIELLAQWLEQQGFPVVQVGLKRSALVGKELENAKNGNVLSPRTMSLFYATDFYDQLENTIVPALRAGAVVLADRYIYTPIARDIVRGADPTWLDSLYSRAIVPDAVFYLQVSTRTLVDRTLTSHGGLDYWESGMDLGVSRDWFVSFLHYQRRLRDQFRRLHERYDFTAINANRKIPTIHAELKDRVRRVLSLHFPDHHFREGVRYGKAQRDEDRRREERRIAQEHKASKASRRERAGKNNGKKVGGKKAGAEVVNGKRRVAEAGVKKEAVRKVGVKKGKVGKGKSEGRSKAAAGSVGRGSKARRT